MFSVVGDVIAGVVVAVSVYVAVADIVGVVVVVAVAVAGCKNKIFVYNGLRNRCLNGW